VEDGALPLAVLAALTPKDVELAFHDDRMEEVPSQPTDRWRFRSRPTRQRAYQIAASSARGVPVVMALPRTLMTEE